MNQIKKLRPLVQLVPAVAVASPLLCFGGRDRSGHPAPHPSGAGGGAGTAESCRFVQRRRGGAGTGGRGHSAHPAL